MTYELGQIFNGVYPSEAADWCNSNRAFIQEIDRADYTVTEPVLDEMGQPTGETKEVPVTNGRRFQIVAIPEPTDEEIAARELAQAKAERADAVSQIIVEVDGLKFDGDETSQQRMARSIVALEDGETMPWVLYDNTVSEVTKAQLKQALRLAGIKQSELWVIPYTKEEASAEE